MLLVKDIKKTYGKGAAKVEALKSVSFCANKGEYIAIMGESGSGKTTLLNLIASLDKASAGTISINGNDISQMKNKALANFRRQELGFVFQEFNLLDSFNNRDNIFLPLVLSDFKYGDMEQRLAKIDEILAIAQLLNKFPYEISGGEKQRVAIARAIITHPSLLLADEPTGALDSNSSKTIMDLFVKINQAGQTIIMVTHSITAAAYAERVLFIKDGTIYNELYKGDLSHAEFSGKINNSVLMLKRKDA